MATAFHSEKWFCLIRASCPERRSRTSSSWVEASVGLELAASAWKLCPIESPADPSLECYLDGVAAKICGAVIAAGREEHLGVLDTGTSDVVEFRDRDHKDE